MNETFINLYNETIGNFTNPNNIHNCEEFKLFVYKTMETRLIYALCFISIALLIRLLSEPALFRFIFKDNIPLWYPRLVARTDIVLFISSIFILAYIFLF
jgi:hypothetical protein